MFLLFLSECQSSVSYPDSTHTGGDGLIGSFAGINPDGTFSSSSAPSPFLIKDELTIEFDSNREYRGSKHYLVITNTSSYRPDDEIKNFQPGSVKMFMGTDALWLVDEDAYFDVGNYISELIDGYSYQEDLFGMWHMQIEYSPAGFKVTADHEELNVDLSRQETTFWPKVWIWLGADDDDKKGSDVHNLTITYTTTSCTSGIINTINLIAFVTLNNVMIF